MSALDPAAGRATPPRVLVVDDDVRVVQLLEIALASHGFDMVSASDGDEALRRAHTDHPDIVVLDVRLPRRSGLEVCEKLRRDPELQFLPIVLVSAAAETDARLQGFGRGADDFLAKPFSPKELIARLKRLLTRSGETRDAERRGRALERELRRVQEESRRAHVEAGRERRQRELLLAVGPELHAIADLDALTRRIAVLAQVRLGAGFVAVLTPAAAGAPFAARALRGDGPERTAALRLEADGPLARLLAALDRPAPRRRLERFEEAVAELPPFLAAGVALLIPLVGPGGLEGVVISEERGDGAELPPGEVETLTALGRVAGSALSGARGMRMRADAALGALADALPGREARARAAELTHRAAGALLFAAAEREEVEWAVRLGPGALLCPYASRLAELEGQDPSGRIARVRVRLEQAQDAGAPCADAADAVLRAARAIATRLAAGEAVVAAADVDLALGADVREAFAAAARERLAAVDASA